MFLAEDIWPGARGSSLEQKHRWASIDFRHWQFFPLAASVRDNVLALQRQIGSDADSRRRQTRFREALEHLPITIRSFDENLRSLLEAGIFLELPDLLFPLISLGRQVTVKGEVLPR